MILQNRVLKSGQLFFLSLLVILITLGFLNSPGTNDMDIWKRWAINADTYGPAAGFGVNNSDYPPFTSVILAGSALASRFFGIDIFYAIKSSILFFLILTTLSFWLWTKDVTAALILHLSLLLNSMALGYIDVFFGPSLILSLWALKQRKYTLFSLAFLLSILTKWQPILIAPFIIIYILNLKQLADFKQIDFKKIFWSMLFPSIVFLSATFIIFGLPEVLQAFQASLSHNYLSGNALNFNWLVTHFLHVFFPEQFGGLVKGQANIILTTSLKITLIPRLLFFLTYIISLFGFFKREKTFENLTIFSMLGYLSYFMFNTGVHENHLFIATILAVILFWINREHFSTMLTLLLISNINLFIFYGTDGAGLMFSRVIGKTVDMALLFSIFNLVFFLLYWGTNLMQIKSEVSESC